MFALNGVKIHAFACKPLYTCIFPTARPLPSSFNEYSLLALDTRVRCCSTRKRYCKFYQVTFYQRDPILMNGVSEIKSFHILSWFQSLGNAAESDKRDLIAELDTMKQLKPHPRIIKLLGCVTESGELIHETVCFIRV